MVTIPFASLIGLLVFVVGIYLQFIHPIRNRLKNYELSGNHYKIITTVESDGNIKFVIVNEKINVRKNFYINVDKASWISMGQKKGYTVPNNTNNSSSSFRPWWVVLGVSKQATKSQINKAYKELAMRYHPDVGGSSIMMAEINAARDLGLKQAS